MEKEQLQETRRALCAPMMEHGGFAALAEYIKESYGTARAGDWSASANDKNGTDGAGLGAFVYELSDSQKVHFAASLEHVTQRRVIYITHNEYAAQKAYDDLARLYGDGAVCFPAREVMLYDVEAKDYNVIFRRVKALDRFISGDYRAAVMSCEAAVQLLPSPELFKDMTLVVGVGVVLDIDKTCARLVALGYERTKIVEARGAFAVRGGILDVYPIDREYALRIELFGDEVDSVRSFSAETQRTLENVTDKVRILPARDVLYSADSLDQITSQIKSEEDIEKFHSSRYFAGIDRYLGIICQNGDTALSYIVGSVEGTSRSPSAAGVAGNVYILDEPNRAFQKITGIAEEQSALMLALIEKGRLLPSAIETLPNFYGFIAKIPASGRIYLCASRSARERELMGEKTREFVISGMSAISYQGNVGLLIADISARISDKWTVILMTKSIITAERLSDALRSDGLPVRRAGFWVAEGDSKLPAAGFINICQGSLASGFEYPSIKLIIISDTEFSHVSDRSRARYSTKRESGVSQGTGGKDNAGQERRAGKGKPAVKIDFFTDLRPGDYVVHQTHGIGVFVGLEQLKVDDAKRDYLKICYKDGGLLYIPTNQLDLVQKYVGSDARAPRVNSLNTGEWAKTKKRVKESLRTLAAELILVYAKRREANGYRFSADTVWQRQFEEQFPYAETDDQLQSVEEIKSDMESPRLMDRLLCGDVGFGKTEVAVRAAFKAVSDSKQVAFLVPTTVLAQQHYQTFKSRFSEFPINIDVLSRFRTPKEQRKITEDLKDGKIDIIVGTHKLLNKSVGFKDLGLLVVDEEQRFGVSQKERLKTLKPDVDVLSLSATPIPRTLHMSMTKIRDISVLSDPPEERFPVQTFVMEYDEDVVREAILREAARGGQVFYLYNRVQGIDIKAMQVARLLPDSVRVAFAHGQMSDRELEDVMLAFVNRQYDVLICTTIIESGLDMPNVNTIIVEDADRMGLSQLYQLRGRVGRSNRLAYAYITHRSGKIITEESEKRLQAIREFTELGAGFKIAMRDMEIRGIGNLLGTEQHGHMESVGYDMYCRLLDEAVREIERERRAESVTVSSPASAAAEVAGSTDAETANTVSAADVTIDIKLSAYIDSLYIEDETQRLEMYQKIAAVRGDRDAADVTDELIDRYGTPGQETENLIKLARVKAIAADCGISAINEKTGQIKMNIARADAFDTKRIAALTRKYRGQVLFSAGQTPYIVFKLPRQPKSTAAALLDALLKFMLDIRAAEPVGLL